MSTSIAPRTDSKITKIVTSKEWVLPPRPKPGRKPSIDTPATKRKAQNRAAQRAFRERRANRVSELETKIMEMEKESSIREGLMNNQIKMLTNENAKLNRIIRELTDKLNQIQQPVQQVSPSPSDQQDCGICSKEICICDAVGLREEPTTSINVGKRGSEVDFSEFKPLKAVPLKRPRQEEHEIDFTAKFMKRERVVEEIKPMEFTKCGFCSDDTPCVCREIEDSRKLPPPPTVETISTSATSAASAAMCTGNPGTCQQCQRDPMSSLFCTTLASKESNMRSEPIIRRTSGYIPCSDAYKRLSQHENFNKGNMDGVIGKLNTRGMLVDSNSVNNVLRELDRKFGNN